MTAPGRPQSAIERAACAASDPAKGARISGNSAEECIDNFIKKQEAAMRNQCVQDLAQNRRMDSNPRVRARRQREVAAEQRALNTQINSVNAQIGGEMRPGGSGQRPQQLQEQRADLQARHAALGHEARDLNAAQCLHRQGQTRSGVPGSDPNQDHGCLPGSQDGY